jgi:hypothetical protein
MVGSRLFNVPCALILFWVLPGHCLVDIQILDPGPTSASFECSFNGGLPTTAVNFFRTASGTQQLQASGRISKQGSILVITELNVEDEDMYWCCIVQVPEMCSGRLSLYGELEMILSPLLHVDSFRDTVVYIKMQPHPPPPPICDTGSSGCLL